MSRGRRKHAEEHEEHGPDERWMASYMDMVTVLMCMFIVLFAMSTVDAKKFDLLRNSLATGFGQTDVGKIDTAKGTVVPANMADNKAENFGVGAQAVKEVDNLKDLEAKVEASLAAQGLENTVEFQIDQRGLTIRLVDQQAFFAPNSTALAGSAPRVLDAVAPVLKASGLEIAVEGHADVRVPMAPYPTNWELSSGRAVSVLRRLVENGGIDPARIGAVGYGSSRPLALGDSPADLARNRRVDIVALSSAPDAVRALIPDVLSGAITDGSKSTASTGPPTSPTATTTAGTTPNVWLRLGSQTRPSILLPEATAGR